MTIPKDGAGDLDPSVNKRPVTSENFCSTHFVNKANVHLAPRSKRQAAKKHSFEGCDRTSPYANIPSKCHSDKEEGGSS